MVLNVFLIGGKHVNFITNWISDSLAFRNRIRLEIVKWRAQCVWEWHYAVCSKNLFLKLLVSEIRLGEVHADNFVEKFPEL